MLDDEEDEDAPDGGRPACAARGRTINQIRQIVKRRDDEPGLAICDDCTRRFNARGLLTLCRP